MWQRIRTAIVLLILVGVAMFALPSPVLMLPLLLFAAAVAGFEWTKISAPSAENAQPVARQRTQYGYIYATATLLATAQALWFAPSWVILWAAACVVWLLVIGWVKAYPSQTHGWYHPQRLAVLGVLLIAATMTAVFALWQQSPWLLLYVFVLVWCADSGAYFVGRKFGRRKMAPVVSPNKSVEGLLGGLAAGSLVVLAVAFGRFGAWSGLAIGLFLLLSLVTIVMSVFGDLFESMLKRHAGVKDSGRILPGHGGILDRIDSQMSAMPIFALGFWALQHFLGVTF